MKFTKIALSLLCSTLLLCGCVKNNDVVLKINNKEITRGEFYDGYNKIKNAQFKDAPAEMKKDDSYASLALKSRYVNDFIARTLLEEEFVKREITASPDEVKAKKQEIVSQIGSEEKFKTILKENNISEKKAEEDFANEVKIQKLASKLVGKDVSDADAEKFYKSNKEQFTIPEKAEVSHILIDTNPESIKRKIVDADKDAKLSAADIDAKVKEEVANKQKLANEVQQKAAKNPKDFAKLAEQYSDDEVTAKKGGDLGFITKNEVVKEFADAAFKQKVGVVGPLVKSEYGLHIILVKDRAAAGSQSFATVKNDLKKYLSEKKKIEALQNYVDNLKKAASIEFVDETLKPETINKQIQDAIAKQIELQKQSELPKTNQKEEDKK